MKAIILNDTRRNIGHIGCAIVMDNIFYLCKKFDIQVIGSFKHTSVYCNGKYIKLLAEANMVIVNGEGTCHHDQRAALELMKGVEKAKKFGIKCYLINSVWQDNIQLNHSLCYFDKIFVRESLSKKSIQDVSNKLDVSIVPDLSLYSRDVLLENSQISKLGDLIFVDNVNWGATKRLAEKTMFSKAKAFYLMDGLFFLRIRTIKLLAILCKSWILPKILKLHHIKSSSLVVTGRFHALCLSLKYSTPCLSIRSNTHKQEGMLIDIGLPLDKYLLEPSLLQSPLLIRRVLIVQ